MARNDFLNEMRGLKDPFFDGGQTQATTPEPVAPNLYDQYGIRRKPIAKPAATEFPASEEGNQTTSGPTPGAMSDVGNLALRGLASTGQGLAYLTGLEGIERGLAGVAERATERLSPAQRAASESDFFADGGFGPAVTETPLRSIGGALVESLPATVAGFGLGGVAAKGASAVGKGAAARGLPGSVLARPAVAGAAGFGAGEGLISAGISGSQIKQGIDALQPDDLQDSSVYQELLGQGETPENAKAQIAERAASQAAWESGALTALLGAPMGAAFGRLFAGTGRLGSTPLRAAGVGAVGEAAQESAQSAAEQNRQNVALQEFVDPSIDPMEGVANAAVGGGFAGAAMGGTLGLLSQRFKDRKQQTPETQDATGTVQRPRPTTDQATGTDTSDRRDTGEGAQARGRSDQESTTSVEDRGRGRADRVATGEDDAGRRGSVSEGLSRSGRAIGARDSQEETRALGKGGGKQRDQRKFRDATSADTKQIPGDRGDAGGTRAKSGAGIGERMRPGQQDRDRTRGDRQTGRGADDTAELSGSRDRDVEGDTEDRDRNAATRTRNQTGIVAGRAEVADRPAKSDKGSALPIQPDQRGDTVRTGRVSAQADVADVRDKSDADAARHLREHGGVAAGSQTARDDDIRGREPVGTAARPDAERPSTRDRLPRGAEPSQNALAGRAEESTGGVATGRTAETQKATQQVGARDSKDAKGGAKTTRSRKEQKAIPAPGIRDGGGQLRQDRPRLSSVSAEESQKQGRAKGVGDLDHAKDAQAETDRATGGQDRGVMAAEIPATEGADRTKQRSAAAPDIGAGEKAGAKAGRKASNETREAIQARTSIDKAAHEAATSPQNNLPEPTQAQKEAGNYKKGDIKAIPGLPIKIENPKGSIRRGPLDGDGKPKWENKMESHYGYFAGTKGKDGDEVDTFIGPRPAAFVGDKDIRDNAPVWVVDQVVPGTNKLDEHKVMLGFESEAEARKGYLGNYEKGWQGLGNITQTTVSDLKTWLKEGDTTKPFSVKAQTQTGVPEVQRSDKSKQLPAEVEAAAPPLPQDTAVQDRIAKTPTPDATEIDTTVQGDQISQAAQSQVLPSDIVNKVNNKPYSSQENAERALRLRSSKKGRQITNLEVTPVEGGWVLRKKVDLASRPTKVRPNDVVRKADGKPFSTESSAQQAQRVRARSNTSIADYQVTPVEGGFVLRQETTDEQTPEATQETQKREAQAKRVLAKKPKSKKLSIGQAESGSSISSVEEALKLSTSERRGLLDSGKLSIEQSPPAARPTAQASFNPTTRKITLYADNITPSQARGILLHEAVHASLQDTVGSTEYQNILDQVERNVREQVPAYANARQRVPSDTPASMINEETLAYLVETQPQMNLVKRFIALIRQGLRKLGLVQNYSPADLQQLARDALRRFVRGEEVYSGTAQETAFSDTSPKDIDNQVQQVTADKRTVMQVIGDAFGDKVDDTRRQWLALLTREQVADVGSDVLPQTKAHLKTAQLMEADKVNHTEKAAELADTWTNIVFKDKWRKTKVGRELADIMHTATIEQVDPANPKHADRPAYADLHKRYQSLPDDVQKLYVEVRDAYAQRSKDFRQALENRIDRSELSNKAKLKLKDEIRQQFESGNLEVYFPLKRFGDYWVAVERGTSRQFMMFERSKDQRAEIRRLKAEGFKDNDITFDKKIEKARQAFSGDSEFLTQSMKLLDESSMDAAEAEAMKDTLYQLYLQTLPEFSSRKSAIHRKNTPGFDTDALRAFSFHMFHGANQLARLNYGDQLSDQLRDMESAASDLTELKAKNKAADIISELRKRYEWATNPTNSTWTSRATGFGFGWYLGGTPAAALVNLTQQPIVALPVLGSRFGMGKSAKALGKANADYVAMMTSKRKLNQVQAEFQGDLGRMISAMVEGGVFDRTLVASLVGASEADATLSPVWNKGMKWLGFAFHHAERMNREATGIAAYRLARQSGMKHDAAVDYTRDAVYQSHFDYSNANRARFMQNDAAKVFLLFRQYSQNMTYFLYRNLHQWRKAQTPELRAEAGKRLGGTLAMTAMFAGALGLPMAEVLTGLVEFGHDLFGDEDEPFDAELALRNHLADLLGPTLGSVITQGAIPGIDLASRTSLSQLWFRAPDRELEGHDLGTYWLEQFAGPLAAIPINMLRGQQLIADGHTQRGIETMSPKFFKDLLRGERYITEGVNTLRGDPLLSDPSFGQIFAQSIGFTPRELAARYDENNMLRRMEKRIQNRRRNLVDGFTMALRFDDTEGRKEIIERIKRFNKRYPGIRIKPSTLRRSIQGRARRSAETKQGLFIQKGLREELNQLRFAA